MPQERVNGRKVHSTFLHLVDLVPKLIAPSRMATAKGKDNKKATQSAAQSLRLDNLLEKVKQVRSTYQSREFSAAEKQSSLHFCAASTSSQSPTLALMLYVSFCTISDSTLISPQWTSLSMPSYPTFYGSFIAPAARTPLAILISTQRPHSWRMRSSRRFSLYGIGIRIRMVESGPIVSSFTGIIEKVTSD